MGFLYILAPVLKTLYPGKKELIESYKRHLEFFNVNPYFVTIPVGITIAMEEQRQSAKSISDMKMIVSGPLAAVGDSLIWAGWRPFSTFVMISLMFLSGYVRITGEFFELTPFTDKYSYSLIVILFLFIYNGPGLFLRYYGLKHGYEKKMGFIGLVKKIVEINLVRNIRLAGLLLLGITVAVIFFRDLELSGKLIYITAFPLISFLLLKGVPVMILFYGIVFFSVIIRYI